MMLLLAIIPANRSFAEHENQAPSLVIALDPGHGGKEDGACYYGVFEKDINLKMANLVKQELEKYQNVKVVLSRGVDEKVGLSERVQSIATEKPEVLISLHFNASVSHGSKGASVYITTKEGYRQEMQNLADCFLGEFESLGLANAGTFARVTQMGGRRGDGTFDDYYGLLRHASNASIPSMIVEHCYMDQKEDRQWVREEKGLRQLAIADANAIAAYYGLENENGVSPEIKHANVYGGTTKAKEFDYYAAPQITAVKLTEYDGKTPGIATYEIAVEDEIGVSSIYLVYKNAQGQSVTITMKFSGVLTTGSHSMTAYIPEGMGLQGYALSYVGAYNIAGYDAGYNRAGNEMIGFGKCDWLNRFAYYGEADLNVGEKGSLSTAHAKMIDYEIEKGLRKKQNLYPISFYSY